MATASKQETLASFETKVHAYCEVSSEARDLEGLPQYATQLRQEGDLTTLKAVAQEVDIWLREIYTAEQQAAIAAHMLARGVLEAHLPQSVERVLRKLIRRRSISNRGEAAFVKQVLVNPSLAAQYSGELEAMRGMLEPWDVGADRKLTHLQR